MLIPTFITFIGIVFFSDSIHAGELTKPLLGEKTSGVFQNLVWKRPEHVAPFPQIWHTFKAKKSENSTEKIEYVIKDIPKDRYDEVVDWVALHLFNYEPLYKALSMWWFLIFFIIIILFHIKIWSSTELWFDPEAVNYFKAEWRQELEQKVSVACFRNDGSDEIIGVNILAVVEKSDLIAKSVATVRLHQFYSSVYKI